VFVDCSLRTCATCRFPPFSGSFSPYDSISIYYSYFRNLYFTTLLLFLLNKLQGLGTRTLGTRAWCMHEMGTRSRAGKQFYILKSLRQVNPEVEGRCCVPIACPGYSTRVTRCCTLVTSLNKRLLFAALLSCRPARPLLQHRITDP
jgi:hypothetical protein